MSQERHHAQRPAVPGCVDHVLADSSALSCCCSAEHIIQLACTVFGTSNALVALLDSDRIIIRNGSGMFAPGTSPGATPSAATRSRPPTTPPWSLRMLCRTPGRAHSLCLPRSRMLAPGKALLVLQLPAATLQRWHSSRVCRIPHLNAA